MKHYVKHSAEAIVKQLVEHVRGYSLVMNGPITNNPVTNSQTVAAQP